MKFGDELIAFVFILLSCGFTVLGAGAALGNADDGCKRLPDGQFSNECTMDQMREMMPRSCNGNFSVFLNNDLLGFTPDQLKSDNCFIMQGNKAVYAPSAPHSAVRP